MGQLQRLRRQGDRYRWYALGLTTLGQAAATILASGFGPIAPFLQSDFQVSRAQLGLIATAGSLTAAPSALFGGRAADRVGERRGVIFFGLFSCLSALGVAHSGRFLRPPPRWLVFWFGDGIPKPGGW